MFHGLSAFPLTPTDDTGAVLETPLRLFLERILAANVDSIGLLGSTGSYAYLTREQRRVAVEIAVEAVAGRIPVIVGVGSLRTDDAEDLSRDAQAAGADGLLLAPMSYTPLVDEEVFQHFRAVADAVNLPLCIYNNPGTTKFTFSDSLIGRLSALPNIRAVKMPLPADGDFAGEIARLRTLVPVDFSIGYSGDWGANAALKAGCDAWYSVAGGLLPAPAVAMTKAAQFGDHDRANQIDAGFAPLWELFRRHGSYRVMYMMADVLGLANVRPLRPVLPLSSDLKPQVAAAIQAFI